MFQFLLEPTLKFIQNNYLEIIVAFVAAIVFCAIFYITITSLKRLKTEISLSYPFDIFFPKEGQWSVGYFLVVIIVLGFLIFFLVKGNFYLQPA